MTASTYRRRGCRTIARGLSDPFRRSSHSSPRRVAASRNRVGAVVVMGVIAVSIISSVLTGIFRVAGVRYAVTGTTDAVVRQWPLTERVRRAHPLALT